MRGSKPGGLILFRHGLNDALGRHSRNGSREFETGGAEWDRKPSSVQNRLPTCFPWGRIDSAGSVDQGFPCDAGRLPDKNGDIQYRYARKSPERARLVARRMNALLLREPGRRVRGSDTEDPRMVHWSATNSWEV